MRHITTSDGITTLGELASRYEKETDKHLLVVEYTEADPDMTDIESKAQRNLHRSVERELRGKAITNMVTF